MSSNTKKDWRNLTLEEKHFILRVYQHPDCKDATQPHWSDVGHEALWSKPEQYGFIFPTGNWKWETTEKFQNFIESTCLIL